MSAPHVMKLWCTLVLLFALNKDVMDLIIT